MLLSFFFSPFVSREGRLSHYLSSSLAIRWLVSTSIPVLLLLMSKTCHDVVTNMHQPLSFYWLQERPAVIRNPLLLSWQLVSEFSKSPVLCVGSLLPVKFCIRFFFFSHSINKYSLSFSTPAWNPLDSWCTHSCEENKASLQSSTVMARAWGQARLELSELYWS